MIKDVPLLKVTLSRFLLVIFVIKFFSIFNGVLSNLLTRQNCAIHANFLNKIIKLVVFAILAFYIDSLES